MTDESLGVLLLGTLIGSPLLVGVGCGMLAADTTTALTNSSEAISAGATAATEAIGGEEVAVVAGALTASTLLLCSSFISTIALSAGSAAYASYQAYTSEKSYMNTAADIMLPTSYLYKPDANADSKQMSEMWKTFKGYVKAVLSLITLPTLAIGTALGLAAKFVESTFPEQAAKFQEDISDAVVMRAAK